MKSKLCKCMGSEERKGIWKEILDFEKDYTECGRTKETKLEMKFKEINAPAFYIN